MADDVKATITHGGNSVDIIIQRVEHSFNKQLTTINVPKQDPPITWLIDLQRLHEVIKVTGYLEDESGSTGLSKKTTLRTILQSSGTMTLTWGSGVNEQVYVVNISKGEVRETPGYLGDKGSEKKTFDVMIQFTIGQHKG